MDKEKYEKLSQEEKQQVPVKILFRIGYEAIQKQNKEVEKNE